MFTLEQVKSEFEASRNRLINISDDAISDILQEYSDSTDINDIFAAIMDEEPSSEPSGDDVTGSDLSNQALAITLAREMDDNVVFNQHTERSLDAKEISIRAAVIMMKDIIDQYTTIERNADGSEYVNTSRLDVLPIPGTEAKKGRVIRSSDDKDLGPIEEDNITRRVDKFSVDVVKDGQKKKEPRSFWKEYTNNLSIGKSINEIIKGLKQALDAKQHTNAPRVYQELSTERATSMLARYTKRKGSLLSLVKGAINCRNKWIEIVDNTECKVELEIDRHDVDGVIREDIADTIKPFCLQDTKSRKFMNLSVTEFLAIDVDIAMEKQGTYSAVIATIARAAKVTTTGLPKVNTNEEGSAYLAELAAYFDQRLGDARKRESSWIEYLRKDEHALRSFYSLSMAWDGVFKTIQPLAEALQAKDIQTEARERAKQQNSSKREQVAKAFADKHNEEIKNKLDGALPKENKLANLMK